MPLRTICFLAGSTHFCKTVRLDFGFCLDSAGLVFGNSFLAGAAERTENLEPQVTTFWFRRVLQAPAKCFHRRRTNLGRHLLQSLGKTRTGVFHAGLCLTMPTSDGASPVSARACVYKSLAGPTLRHFLAECIDHLTHIGQALAPTSRRSISSC